MGPKARMPNSDRLNSSRLRNLGGGHQIRKPRLREVREVLDGCVSYAVECEYGVGDGCGEGDELAAADDFEEYYA